MALQWLEDPAAAVSAWRALLVPGGRLAVATLIDGSFAEWREALAEVGVEAPSPRFPSYDEARAWFGPYATCVTMALADRHPDALAFLRALRLSGADAADSPALDAGTMRRAMRAFEASGSAVTYEVLIGIETV
jgi:malonyl-CoA O-methyltransferase